MSKPIRCLVLQLARLSDTLQSLMALRAAKQLYPDLEITFVVRERFAHAAKRIPWIEKTVVLPTETILEPMIIGEGGEANEAESLSRLAQWLSPLLASEDKPWDLVVNWSYSETSSWLTALIPGKTKMGYTRQPGNSALSSGDGWSHYIQGIVQSGIDQNIHLTDILTTQLLTALQIGYGDPASDGSTPVTSKSFFALELKEIEAEWCSREFVARKFIGIQLGAGDESLVWAPENWAEVASSILRRHPECSIVLLGDQNDTSRAERFRAHLRKELGTTHLKNVISAVGSTSFDLWTAIISKCNWVLSVEGAAVHLSSVLGTRVLTVATADARLSETGPYGNGHYVVAPKDAQTAISPQAVYGTWAYASSEWSHRRNVTIDTHFSKLGFTRELGTVKIYRSKIRGTQDGGGVFYDQLTRSQIELIAWNSMALGHVARSWYCGWVPPAAQEIARETLSPPLLKSLRELEESCTVLTKICEEAKQTAHELNRKTMKLKSQKLMGVADKEELQSLGLKLAELDGLIERMGNTHPSLLGIARMAKVMMHNVAGTSLAEISKESAEAYRQLLDGVGILRGWVKATLALTRPVAVAALASEATNALAPVKSIPGRDVTP